MISLLFPVLLLTTLALHPTTASPITPPSLNSDPSSPYPLAARNACTPSLSPTNTTATNTSLAVELCTGLNYEPGTCYTHAPGIAGDNVCFSLRGARSSPLLPSSTPTPSSTPNPTTNTSFPAPLPFLPAQLTDAVLSFRPSHNGTRCILYQSDDCRVGCGNGERRLWDGVVSGAVESPGIPDLKWDERVTRGVGSFRCVWKEGRSAEGLRAFEGLGVWDEGWCVEGR